MKNLIISFFVALFFLAACGTDSTIVDYVPVTGVEISETALYLVAGNEAKLTAKVLPEKASDKGMIWNSSNSKVIAINQTGEQCNLLALQAGESTIIVRSLEGAKQAQCKVTVYPAPVPVTGIKFKEESLKLVIGKTAKLEYTITPSNATNPSVTWESDDPAHVTVDEDGVATAVDFGFATIKVTALDGGFSDQLLITVTHLEATSITLNKNTLSLFINDSEELQVTSILPVNATDKDMITWESSAPNVATVVDGLVTAVSEGTAKITVFTANKAGKDYCDVTVKKKVEIPPTGFPEGTQATNNWWGSTDGVQHYEVAWFLDNSSQSEFIITRPEQLAGLSILCNGNGTGPLTGANENGTRGKIFKLGADLDLSKHYWVPIGRAQTSFGGWFDGQGHTITGLYMDYYDDVYEYTSTLTNINSSTASATASTGSMTALFGRTNNHTAGAYIKNIVFGTGHIKQHPSNYFAGCLIGFKNSNGNLTVSNIINMGVVVEGGNMVGGIIGGANNASSFENLACLAPVKTISNSTLASPLYVGGLIGAVAKGNTTDALKNSYFAGSITVEPTTTNPNTKYLGALIGGIASGNNGAALGVGVPNPVLGTDYKGANNFYLDDGTIKDVGGSTADLFTGSAIATAAEMKTSDFLTKLNVGLTTPLWVIVPGENNGFPVLRP